MKTYRIVKEKIGGSDIYKVQYKCLFWWKTAQEIDYRGGEKWYSNIHFLSVDEAEKYINELHSKTLTVVKTITKN